MNEDETVHMTSPDSECASSEKITQGKSPASPTNAGVVVAWIGIALCGISLAGCVFGVAGWLFVMLREPDNPWPSFARAIGWFFELLVPYAALQYMRVVKASAKSGERTAGASVVAVVVVYILVNALVFLIGYVEAVVSAFTASLSVGEWALWDIAIVKSIGDVCLGIATIPLFGFIAILATLGVLVFYIGTGLVYLALYPLEHAGHAVVLFVASKYGLLPYLSPCTVKST